MHRKWRLFITYGTCICFPGSFHDSGYQALSYQWKYPGLTPKQKFFRVSGISLGMRPAIERHYIVTMPLIGWVWYAPPVWMTWYAITRARFLSLARTKLRLCSANHRQVTEVTCPVIGRAQPELTPSKRQKTGPDRFRGDADVGNTGPVRL